MIALPFYGRCIPLKPSRTVGRREQRGEVATQFAWEKAPPFCANPRGVLIHRVRHVTTIKWDGTVSHFHVDFLCSNGCNVDRAAIGDVLVSDPPQDRLLCVQCEVMAARWKLPTADRLAGRHVHRGILVARQTCCGGKA